MTEGTKTDAKMEGLLREELEALARQRDQYALAMDTATDPKVAIRLQRTLERIEDEIEGLEESLRSFAEEAPDEAREAPDEAQEAPAAEAISPATMEIPPPGPDWDDEPSTAIYDPDRVKEQLAALESQREELEAENAARAPEPEPVEARPEPKPDLEAVDAQTGVHEPVPSEPVAPAAEPAYEPAPPPPEPTAPAGDDGSPLGPVWMDGLSPATGKIPTDAGQPEPDAVSPDVLGDDPFALPGRPAAAQTDSSSPFGTAVGSPGADFSPVSVLDDDVDDTWGFAPKLALFLVVAAFLAGAFYVMSIG